MLTYAQLTLFDSKTYFSLLFVKFKYCYAIILYQYKTTFILMLKIF